MRPLRTVKIETVDCENIDDNDDPLELIACRVCLSTDTKLFNLHECSLSQTFGDLTGTPVSPTDGLPQHLCVLCCALLNKSARFRAKCRSTHIFLQDLRVQHPVITTSNIRRIDRTNFQLDLMRTRTKNHEYLPTEQELCESRFIDDVVKNESLLYVPVTHLTANEIDSLNEDTLTDDLTVVDFLFDNDDIKEEPDKPVKWTKKKKESKKKLKKVKTEQIKTEQLKTEEEQMETELETDVNSDTELIVTARKRKSQKRKRPFNQKFEEDFIGFSKLYNVDVEFLSKEQQLADVEARKDSDAYKNARFRCETCYRGFMTERAFEKHAVWHNPASGNHACDVCKQFYPSREKLLNHLRKHRMHFKCRQCSNVAKDSTKAKQHHRWHEGFKYDCKHCGRNFNAKSTQLNHVRENHTPVTCVICGESIAGTIELSRHKTMHTKMVNCTNCSMEFHSEEALHRHVSGNNSCTSNRLIKSCAICGDGFITNELLRRHVDDQHKGTTCTCEDCGATFVSDRSLSIHWKRVHRAPSEKPQPGAAPRQYMCEVCAHSYPSEVQLKYHQRVHTGERPHQCPMCPKSFRMHTNLRVHINTHTGERPYKCALCPETFKSYSQRHKHKLLVHTKERRHKCGMCDKTYVVSFDLKEHIRFAHMKIPRPPRNRRRKKDTIPMPLNALASALNTT